MHSLCNPLWVPTAALAAVLLIVVPGCGHVPAPVEDLSVGTENSQNREPAETIQRRPQVVDGTRHRVRSGETLYGIAFRYGLDYRDMAGWNRIGPPYEILVGQQLRLTPPTGYQPERSRNREIGSETQRTVVISAGSDHRPVTTSAADEPDAVIDSEPGPSNSEASGSIEPSRDVEPSATESTPAQIARVETSEPDRDQGRTIAPPAPSAEVLKSDPKRWLWPSSGRVSKRFDPGAGERKGITLAAREGEPVVAAADGLVVYSGNGLIGYGELVIIKHSNRLLSAYAHNRKRLVGEGAMVAAGTPIAETGRDGRGQVGLHFEIRKQGQPVDPLGYLPAR